MTSLHGPVRSAGAFARAAVLVAAVAFLGGADRSVAADPTRPMLEVVRLRTGETLKGRLVVERCDETVAVIEDYVTGAERRVAWPTMAEGDERRLKALLRLPDVRIDAEALVEITCVVLTYRLNVGTAEVRGVETSETDAAVVLKTRAGLVTIPEAAIVSREVSTCDGTEVYTPSELAAERKKALAPKAARDWVRLAMYCERVGAFAEAREAYEAAATDSEYPDHAAARAKAIEMRAAERDQAALAAIRDLRAALENHLFPKVRSGIDAFGAAFPGASAKVAAELQALKALFKKQRDAFFAAEAEHAFVKILQALIYARVKPKDAALNDVLAWAKRALMDESMAELVKRLQLTDPAVTPEEAKGFWEARAKNAWRQASYGEGTFVVEPPKRKKGLEPVRTRDQWWLAATTADRAAWVLAWFVESSGLFEVDHERVKIPCAPCDGTGEIRKELTGGGVLTYVCPRCSGLGYDLAVRLR